MPWKHQLEQDGLGQSIGARRAMHGSKQGDESRSGGGDRLGRGSGEGADLWGNGGPGRRAPGLGEEGRAATEGLTTWGLGRGHCR